MKVPIYRPQLGAAERANFLAAFDEGWISGRGRFIDEFEQAFADKVERKHAVAVFNGTVALHLTLHSLGVGYGDKVITPSYTYVACANSIRYVGADPVFVDSDLETLQGSKQEILRAVEQHSDVKAVIYPHLYGFATRLDELAETLFSRGIHLIEDCSEMLGAKLSGRPAGETGIASTYSFFGNKTITTGEGGMVATDDDSLAAEMRKARNQGANSEIGYFFDSIGFNFRMTNVQAAIGAAQLERLDDFLIRKKYIQTIYDTQIDRNAGTFLGHPDDGVSSFWLSTLILGTGVAREEFLKRVRGSDVDARPGFIPIHQLPHFADVSAKVPNAESFANRVVLIPNFPDMSDSDLELVVDAVNSAVRQETKTP